MSENNEASLYILAEQLGQLLVKKKLKLVTAESCTGGWVAQVITAVAGSSEWFERGFVTYSNAAKQEMLGVHQLTLQQFGAVSQETAIAMVQGALRQSHADVGVSITGIAGPAGGTLEKPVGLVWFGWGVKHRTVQSVRQQFSGDRTQVRASAVEFVLKGLLAMLRKDHGQ